MFTNFHLAPPPKTVDGLLAVPMDIQSIEAVFRFDGASSTATADATISYTVGPTAGNPIFDLRQEIACAWLDGSVIPVDSLEHHDFGTGPYTDLRVIDSVQAAGSDHTLRVQYPLAMPDSQLGGSYLPAIEWSAGPKLRFVFGLSDLNKARYAEAWLPANLIFDQFSISLEIQVINTLAEHSVITNGAVTTLGTNHWRVEFPDRFTALSPMLEVRASDSLSKQTDTVALPVSGKTVTLEGWKPSNVTLDLGPELDALKALLTDYESGYGPYLHDSRFIAFFNGSGGMEYEGGTTAATWALPHETFHSWYARGIKPAGQADGWWDEGFATFHDDGADDAIPFDFADPPRLLCSRDPWQRHTPGNSYSDGKTFWAGIASLLGIANLHAFMKELYETYKGKPVSTQMIEEFLLAKSGNAELVDAFHRFVYGLTGSSPAPDLWMRDDPGHGGDDFWEGPFWDSPDLWIRNADDGGTAHQAPEFGQDNWFYARVRNKANAGEAQHFVVTFHSKGFAGTEFVYPGDFLPCIAAKAEFELGAGDTRIVKARWPRLLVPPENTHTCLLASVLTRADRPLNGAHVWEDRKIAQKNLTVVDLQPNMFVVIPVVIGNLLGQLDSAFDLELWRPQRSRQAQVSLLHRSSAFFKAANVTAEPFKVEILRAVASSDQPTLECGGRPPHNRYHRGRIMTSDAPDLVLRRFPDSLEARFPQGPKAAMRVNIPRFSQNVIGLKVHILPQAKIGESLRLHFVQRHSATGRIMGGIAVQINVTGAKALKEPNCGCQSPTR